MGVNISFYDKNYNIDETAMSEATAKLQSHLTTVMNGSGSVVNLNGVSYNVDSTKLATATNNFVSYLGTIVGTGCTVIVNGVEYSIDSDKLSDSISDLEVVLGGLISDDSSDALGMNEYGFYFNQKYERCSKDGSSTSLIFLENGSIEYYDNGTLQGTFPCTYSQNTIEVPSMSTAITVYNEGRQIDLSIGGSLVLGDGKYVEGDYTYLYDTLFDNGVYYTGWHVTVNDENKASYGAIKTSVNGVPVVGLSTTFQNCTNLTTAPVIPSSVMNMNHTFSNCTNLTGNVEINADPTEYAGCFIVTEKQITITGSCSDATKAALAATANNGNVSY